MTKAERAVIRARVESIGCFEQELIKASIRLLTGLRGMDYKGEFHYKGIKDDALHEFTEILTEIKAFQ